MNSEANSGAPDASTETAALEAPRYSLGEIALYFLKLGSLGFGGPVALVGYMHRDLVEKRGWITERDYDEGLALAQLAPGPLAAQLAIYLGYVHYGVLGATLAGIAFVVPSFLIVVALGWAYVEYGGLSWMQAVFFGVGPCVIGIIAQSAYKLTRRTIGKDWLLWIVYLVSAACTIITESEIIWLFLGAGILVWVVRQPPKLISRGPMVFTFGLFAIQEPERIAQPLGQALWEILLFFTKAGAFVFGSGLAIVPFLYGGVVKEYGWLKDQQFLDAVAVAMITPGPVVITVGFIGYLVAGFWGACVAAIGTFLPCYVFTVLPAPYFKKYGHRPGIKAFVDGITAAAVGAITGAVVVLGRRTILDDNWQPDVTKSMLLIAAVGVLALPRKIPEPILVLIAAILGLILFPLVRPQ